eukprot:157289_1
MPEQGNKSQHIHVQIIDANNIAIFDTQQWVEIKNSIIGFQYKIPSDTKGGEYKIKIKYHWTAHKTVAERSFQILTSNNKLNPKIRKQVEFLKNVYSPGEQCEIKISCIDCNNNVLIASIVAKIDDHIIYELSNSSPMTLSYDIGKIDNIQSVIIKFQLPYIILEGNGNIAITYQRDSIVETLTKTIPITLGYLTINQYPESNNYLIPGMNGQRIYFEGFNPKTNEPADYVGEIVSLPDENVVSTVTSVHEGRAVSDYFDVDSDKKYVLRLISPVSCKGQIISLNTTPDKDFKLVQKRVVLSSAQNAYISNDEININLQANIESTYKVKLFKRELLISTINVIVNDTDKVYHCVFDKNDLKDNHIGILRITVCTNYDTPIAERLIFRHPNSFVHFEIDTDVIGIKTKN